MSPDNYYLYPGAFRGFSSGTVFNEFDESFMNKIPKFDTLVVREYHYNFKKR